MCFDVSRIARGGVERECQLRMQSGKFVVTPLDDTTLIDSQKKCRELHACLFSELKHGVPQPCGPKVFLLLFFFAWALSQDEKGNLPWHKGHVKVM